MFHHLPLVSDEEDKKLETEREVGLSRIRLSVAKRWNQIMGLTNSRVREENRNQVMAFLQKMNEHFEPVPYGPAPAEDVEGEASGRGHGVEETPPNRSESQQASPSSSGTILDSKEQFDWAFLDLDGAVWAILKAKKIVETVCVGAHISFYFSKFRLSLHIMIRQRR